MKNRSLCKLFSLIILMFIHINVIAAEDEKLFYEDKDVRLRFVQFTPQQIGSFYEGREFNKAAVERLMAACFVTVIIENKSKGILWLDLDDWAFSQDGRKFERLTRSYWQAQWQEVGLKQAHRSTFGWTLMPAVRNLYPDESVGGRIPIPMQSRPFVLTLNFPTGDNRQGKVKSVTMDNMLCTQEQSKSTESEKQK